MLPPTQQQLSKGSNLNDRLWSLHETAGDMSGGKKDRAESRVEGPADIRMGSHAQFQ